MIKPVIGFAGLTHLGINSLVASAERGFNTVGFHDDSKLIQDLNNSKLHIEEPDLELYLNKNRSKIEFSSNIQDLAKCNIVYISTDVPTDDYGNSDLTTINLMIEKVGSNIKDDCILIILCQVNPGFTRNINIRNNKVFYQVETLIFGRAIERALNPERFIVGCVNPEVDLPQSYNLYLNSFNCPILKMKYESAELAKIAINMFLISSVSTTNMLAEVCEKIGASWSEIAPSLRLDKRIGQFAYLNPGLGIAGGNLERDMSTIISIAKQHGIDSSLVSSWIENSISRKEWALNILKGLPNYNSNNLEIGLLGLAYKENTHSIKNSASVELIKKLTNFQIKAYDPVVKNLNFLNLKEVDDANLLVNNIDILIIMTPWSEFKEISISQLMSMRGRVIIDPYGLLKNLNLNQNGYLYFSLGESFQKEIKFV